MKADRKVFTKKEYLSWIATRGEPGIGWGLDNCYAADRLIKQEAMKAFNEHLKSVEPKELAAFCSDMASIHFGTVEVDQLFMKLNCYPDWMDRS